MSTTAMLPPPSPPASLTVMQGTPATSTLEVSWGSVADAMSYELQRSDDGATGWAQVYSDMTAGYSDSGLSDNTTYHYRVNVTTNAGTSDWSSVVMGTTLIAAPATPANLSVAQGTPDSSALDVSWDSVATADSYQLEFSLDGSTNWTQILDSNATSAMHTGLNANTTYHYRVRATNAGGESAWSSVETGTTASSDLWHPVSTTGAPSARSDHEAIWTGSRMIVWGGDQNGGTGGIYNPVTNTWDGPTSTNGAPSARNAHSLVWTGNEMIVWGGFNNVGGRLNDGAMYNVGSDSWTPTSMTDVPAGREYHSTVWTGTHMIVWGGWTGTGVLNTGARFNPITNTWTSATSTNNAPAARNLHSAVWSGTEMIVWGGEDFLTPVASGARYNPSNDTWTAMSTTNAPTTTWSHEAVWTTDGMVVWGGYSDLFTIASSGAAYDPIQDEWTVIPTANGPGERAGHTMLWTDHELIIWGGLDSQGVLNTGVRTLRP